MSCVFIFFSGQKCHDFVGKKQKTVTGGGILATGIIATVVAYKTSPSCKEKLDKFGNKLPHINRLRT